jgi:hypothetical protein
VYIDRHNTQNRLENSSVIVVSVQRLPKQWGQPPLSSLGSQEQATYVVNQDPFPTPQIAVKIPPGL